MPQPAPTAEKIFGATQAELTAQAQIAIGDTIVLAAGAFWPNGVTTEMMETGTHRGRKLGAVFGPTMTEFWAFAGAFSGADTNLDDYTMAKPLIVAVTPRTIYIVEPACGTTPPTTFKTFDRATTQVQVKRRGAGRVILLDDDAADNHFRLLGTAVRIAKRSGPERAVLTELTKVA